MGGGHCGVVLCGDLLLSGYGVEEMEGSLTAGGVCLEAGVLVVVRSLSDGVSFKLEGERTLGGESLPMSRKDTSALASRQVISIHFSLLRFCFLNFQIIRHCFYDGSSWLQG